ncbi:hypothetical protein BDV29DRAFT_155942 [Aspergillus leporis]|uniref:Uncharacterized protein n=1 Tax=Aspergillus leporis TaxID=41062 RepID=A0A5N5X525_9EURO|nr:hypothetical protein BDV29DRAFT_155942 [Aspergillus leporis]
MLDEDIRNDEYVGRFEKPKTSAAEFDPQPTTLLSPHLHFGSLSVRKLWWDVQVVLEKRSDKNKPNAPIPTNLPGQLHFREMYFAAQAALGHKFSQTYGNPIAVVHRLALTIEPVQSARRGQTGRQDLHGGFTKGTELLLTMEGRAHGVSWD